MHGSLKIYSGYSLVKFHLSHEWGFSRWGFSGLEFLAGNFHNCISLIIVKLHVILKKKLEHVKISGQNKFCLPNFSC